MSMYKFLAIFYLSYNLLLYSITELDRLKDIQEIRGSLTIELFNKQNFSYLSNLRVIGSDPSQVLSFMCNGTGDRIKYTVFIEGTDLVSLNLSSLERIENGGIQLINNPALCYIGNLSYYITNNSANICAPDDDYRRPEEECGKLSANYITLLFIVLLIQEFILHCFAADKIVFRTNELNIIVLIGIFNWQN